MGEALWLDIPSISQIGFLSLRTCKVPQYVYWYMFFSADCGGKQGCALLFVCLEAILSQKSPALFLLWFIHAIPELLGWHSHVFVPSSPSFSATHWTSMVSGPVWDEDSICVLSPGALLVLALSAFLLSLFGFWQKACFSLSQCFRDILLPSFRGLAYTFNISLLSVWVSLSG